ncbi:MAG: TolC family protein [Cytophagales bacterium]|nr:TolC family protein [Cytophagales bacterium]
MRKTRNLIIGSFILFPFTPLHGQLILSLDSALAIAVSNSPDIKQAEYQLNISRELLNAKNASLKSNFNLQLNPLYFSHGRRFDETIGIWRTTQIIQSAATFNIDQPIKWTDGNIRLTNRFLYQDFENQGTPGNTAFSNSLTIRLDQPVFTYNRTKLELQELELDLENSILGYALQRLNIERFVTQNYYLVYENALALQIAKDELDNTQENYEITKNKVDAGLLALEELYQAELNLSTAKSNYHNQKVQLENSKDNFKQLIGLNIYEEFEILTDIEVDPVPIDLSEAIDHGLSQRLELRQREIGVANSQFELIRTKSFNEFYGNISATFGLIGDSEDITQIYNPATDNQELSITLSVPIFDWGERKSRIKASEYQIQSSELDFSQERVDIIVNIRAVYRNLQNLLNQIEIAGQGVKNAQLTYEVNVERYKNGDLTGMDLNLFQTQLSEQKLSLTQALIDYKLELLNMKIQTLWDFDRDMSYFPEEIIKNSIYQNK